MNTYIRKSHAQAVVLLLYVFCFTFSMAQTTKTVIVKRGDSFELLAKKHGITVEALKNANPTATYCHVGMKLQVPLPPPPPKVERTESYTSAPTHVAKKKRNNFWGILGMAFAGASAAYLQSQQQPVYMYGGSMYSYSNSRPQVGPIGSMSDSEFKNYVNGQFQQATQQAIIQTQMDEYREYQQYNQMQRQFSGRDITLDEYRLSKGAALMELNQQNSSAVTNNQNGSGSAVLDSQNESLAEKNKQYWKDKAIQSCPMCVGKGEPAGQCHFCINGYTDSMFGLGRQRCVSCKTKPGVCEYCHGTGKKYN